MVTHEITFRILLTPLRLRLALFLMLLAAFPRMAATADVALVNIYYPPPLATHKAVTVYGSATFARDQERVYLGSEANDNTHVGVGVAPDTSRRLKISGTLRVDGCIWLQNTTGNFRCRWEE